MAKLAVINRDKKRRYRLSHGLLTADSLIAATAITQGIPLLSKNQRDYRFIAGLNLLLAAFKLALGQVGACASHYVWRRTDGYQGWRWINVNSRGYAVRQSDEVVSGTDIKALRVVAQDRLSLKASDTLRHHDFRGGMNIRAPHRQSLRLRQVVRVHRWAAAKKHSRCDRN